MTARTGRPTSDPKRNQFKVRLTDLEEEKLELCAKQSGKTKTDIIRLGIEKVYEEICKN